MGIIIWLIVGGVVGWLASLIMRTDAQQGILLNIVVGIVGAVIAGLVLGGGNINQGITVEIIPLVAARRGHPAGDRQPRSPGHRPLDVSKTATYEGRPATCRGGLFCSGLLQLEAHRQRDLQLLLAGIDLRCPRTAPRRLGAHHRHRRRRRIAAALADREQPDDPHAQRPGVEIGAGPAVGDRLGPRLVKRRLRLVDRQASAR